MFRKHFLSALFVTVAVSSGHAPAAQQAKPPGVEAEEYAVYSALIDGIRERSAYLPVLLSTETLADAGGPHSLSPTDWTDVAEMRSDYTAKNDRPYPLEQKQPGRYRRIHPAGGEGPAVGPGTVIAFSRVGFNGAKDRALVLVRFESGVTWKDQYIVLRKSAAGWRLERRLARFIR